MDRKAIGYHYTCLTASMAIDGTLHPNMEQVASYGEALAKAQQEVEDGTDPMEACLGCLTVYDDGSVAHEEFTLDDLQDRDEFYEEDPDNPEGDGKDILG